MDAAAWTHGKIRSSRRSAAPRLLREVEATPEAEPMQKWGPIFVPGIGAAFAPVEAVPDVLPFPLCGAMSAYIALEV